jgi:hypothetical protein
MTKILVPGVGTIRKAASFKKAVCTGLFLAGVVTYRATQGVQTPGPSMFPDLLFPPEDRWKDLVQGHKCGHFD